MRRGFVFAFLFAVFMFLPAVVWADEPVSLPGYPTSCNCGGTCGYYCHAGTQSIFGSYGPLECVYVNGEPNKIPACPAYEFDNDWGMQGAKIIVWECNGTSPAELELSFTTELIDIWYNCDGPGTATGNPDHDYSHYVQWSHALVRADYDPEIFSVSLESGGTIVNKPGHSAPPLCVWFGGYVKLRFQLRSTSCEVLRRARYANITVTGQVYRSVRSTCSISEVGPCGGGVGRFCREECWEGDGPRFKGQLSEEINLGTVGVQFIGMQPCWD